MKHINVKETLMSIAVCALALYGGLATARFTGTASMVPNKISLLSGQAKQVNAGTLVEPNWDSKGKELAAKGIRAGESVPKNPFIISNADWSSWAFIKVEIPRYSDGRDSVSLVGISDKWTLLQDTKSDDLHTLVYGYKPKLAGGNSTKAEADCARTDSLFTAFKANELTGDKPFVNTLMVYGTLVQCDETDDVKEIVKKAHFDGSASSAAVYSITYELNGGTISGEKYLYTEGESYTPPTPSKDGFKFTGWSPKSIGAGESGDKTFTAGWNANTLTIRFWTNGANRLTDLTHREFDSSSNVIHEVNTGEWDKPFYKSHPEHGLSDQSWLEKDGYHSSIGNNWRIKNNNNIADPTVDMTGYTGSDVANFLGVLEDFKKEDVVVDLIPEWTANTYSIKYNANAPAGSSATGAMSDTSATYDKSKALTNNAFSVPYYTFTSWNTSADGKGTSYNNGASVKNLTATNNGTVNIYAQWKANTFNNVINQQFFYDVAMKNAASFYGNTVTKPAAYNSKFKVATSDFSSFKTPKGFTRRDTISSSTDSKLHPLTDEYTQPGSVITFNVACYPLTYKISYNLDGGTNDSTNPSSYDVMHEVRLKNPTKTGYSFNGWEDANGNDVSGINVGAAASFTSASDLFAETEKRTTGDQTFTAQWAPATGTKYQVIYRQQQNDGSFKVIDTKTYTGTTDATIDAPRLTYAGFKTPNAKKVTITANGSASVTYDYYKEFSITYNLNYGSFTTTAKTTYLSTDSDYTIPRPERNAWTFDGWTGSNGTDPTHDVVIKSGSLGNKTYTANWVGETIAVTCENWSIDYNGNLYRKLSTEVKVVNVAFGTEVSGADWGSDKTANKYVQWYAYHGSSTLTVSKGHHIVYRYFWLTNNDNTVVSSLDRAGNAIPAYGDITTTWKDKAGKIIKQDTYHYPDTEKGLTSFTRFRCTPTWSGGWPDGGYTTYTNERAVNGYKVFKKDAHHIYWDILPASIDTTSYAQVNSWDKNRLAFVSTGPISQADSRVTQTYNIIKYWTIEQPDGNVIRKNWAVNGHYPTGSKISMHFDGDVNNKEKPGWIINDNDFPWYCSSAGEQQLRFSLKDGKPYILDGNIHVDGCNIYQDAYAVRFNVNGGTGNMSNQFISNIGTDAERTLTKNTFTHAGYRFAGWAKTSNATTPDFKDGAVMPVDFGSGSTSTANRKYTCKVVDLYAVWVKD